MNFLNPFFLFGLIAVAVPVVIHLINLRRPKKVSFSTLSFFNELRKSTIRRIRIKKYLLMALRALAILFLALALARPILPPTLGGVASSSSPKAVGIIIDNSASMSRLSEQGLLIDRAKNIGDRIIQNANSDDKFYITTTNGGNAGESQLVNKSRARDQLSKIASENTGNYTSEVINATLKRINEAPQPENIVYIISDGQAGQFRDTDDLTSEIKENVTKQVPVQMIQVQAGNQQNLAISAIELQNQILSKGSPVTLDVEVENTANVDAANQFVSLQVDGEMVGQHKISLAAGDKTKVSFQLVPEKTGDIMGRIILEGDEVTYDNERYFVLNIPQKRSVLLVNNDGENSSFNSYLSPVLRAAEQTNSQIAFDNKTLSEINQANFSQYSAVIFDGVDEVPEYWFKNLQQYVQQDGGILFFPSEQGDINNYNSFFSLFNIAQFSSVVGEYGSFQPVTKTAGLEAGHPILDEVFEIKEDENIKVKNSSVFYYFRYENEASSGSVDILKTTEGHSLLSEYSFGDGMLLVSTLGADPGWSNLPINPVFAPLFYRALLYASSTESGGLQEHLLGEPFVAEQKGEASEAILHLNGTEYKAEIVSKIDGVNIQYPAKEWKPGILTIETGNQKQKIAVNKNIMESRFDTLTSRKWRQMFGDIFAVNSIIDAETLSANDLESKLNASMFGKEIWNWFIWIALLFLVTETVVSKLYKAESIS